MDAVGDAARERSEGVSLRVKDEVMKRKHRRRREEEKEVFESFRPQEGLH